MTSLPTKDLHFWQSHKPGLLLTLCMVRKLRTSAGHLSPSSPNKLFRPQCLSLGSILFKESLETSMRVARSRDAPRFASKAAECRSHRCSEACKIKIAARYFETATPPLPATREAQPPKGPPRRGRSRTQLRLLPHFVPVGSPVSPASPMEGWPDLRPFALPAARSDGSVAACLKGLAALESEVALALPTFARAAEEASLRGYLLGVGGVPVDGLQHQRAGQRRPAQKHPDPPAAPPERGSLPARYHGRGRRRRVLPQRFANSAAPGRTGTSTIPHTKEPQPEANPGQPTSSPSWLKSSSARLSAWNRNPELEEGRRDASGPGNTTTKSTARRSVLLLPSPPPLRSAAPTSPPAATRLSAKEKPSEDAQFNSPAAHAVFFAPSINPPGESEVAGAVRRQIRGVPSPSRPPERGCLFLASKGFSSLLPRGEPSKGRDASGGLPAPAPPPPTTRQGS